MTLNIVLLVLVVALLIAQISLLRRISKFRKLSNAGYDLCIEAVEAHVRGDDWRPIMEKAKVVREEMEAL